jgi:hypothetical protein
MDTAKDSAANSIGKPTFTCAACGGTFDKARSDEEALADLEELFPGVQPENCSVVCGQCWEAMQKMSFE